MAFKMPASLSKPSGFGAFPGARPSGGGLPGMGGIPQRASARMPPPGAGQRAAPRTAPSAAAVVQQNTSETVTFDATHRHWTGKLLLHRDHKFDKEGRGGGGGTWTVTWSGNSDRGVRAPAPPPPRAAAGRERPRAALRAPPPRPTPPHACA